MGRVNRQLSAGAEVNVKIEHDSMKVFFSVKYKLCSLKCSGLEEPEAVYCNYLTLRPTRLKPTMYFSCFHDKLRRRLGG